MAEWVIQRKAGDAAALASRLSVSPIIARLLINRGVKTPDDANAYLNPNHDSLEPVTRMKGVAEAYAVIKEYLDKKNGRICIYGDYDVDGVTSAVMLTKLFKMLAADVFYYIPLREEEGYGLNAGAVDNVYADGCKLLVTCDNGIASSEEILKANKLGMTVIIIDHHEPQRDIPQAAAVINPKQPACPYHYKEYCAAALVYRFALGLADYLNFALPSQIKAEFLQLAAIGTLCDIVPLIGESRIIAKCGLDSLNDNIINKGLKALFIDRMINKKITEYEIGFIIGPCINATGRLETARLAADLLLCEDAAQAAELAAHPARLNDKRKQMTVDAFEKAVETYEKSGENEKIIIVYNPEIHESIAGIVAGKLRDRYNRPAIVLTSSAEEGVAKGSARSVEHYDIFANMSACSHLFKRFGGHAMAAGLSIANDNIPLLKTKLNRACSLTDEQLTEKIYIDGKLELKNVTYALAKQITALAPYGKDNKEPMFGTARAEVLDLRVSNEKNYVRFVFLDSETNRKIVGLCFQGASRFSQMIRGAYNEKLAEKVLNGVLREACLFLDIVYTLEINEYNGDVSVQMIIKDFRISEQNKT